MGEFQTFISRECDNQDQSQYLITTADERTWKFDRPVVFLGEWCRLYDRKHIWQDMDASVAAPYGLGFSKKDTDYAKARALEDKLFPEFFGLLNQHHGMQYSERFWRIVLGHWFRRIVDVLLNRVNTLGLCLQTHEISGTTIYANDHYALATLDSKSTIRAFNDDRWNNALTARVLSLIEAVNFPIELIAEEGLVDTTQFFRFHALVDKKSFKRKILKYGYQCFIKVARNLVRDNDAFIINSYLPAKKAIKLELSLGQWPQIWRSPQFELVEKPNLLLRKSLTKQFVIKSGSNLENISRALLFELLPVCYLEGFSDLNKTVSQQPWPKSPKFIFTSNNFDMDEVFKLWAAIKVESGSKYYTGQHGNKYGTHRYLLPSVEEATADKFLTWGWTDGLPQHTPAFVFKVAGMKANNYNPQGGLLLIELVLNHRVTIWDETSEFVDYFNNQMDFIRALAVVPKQQLTIRLHAGYRYQAWGEGVRWHEFDPELKIDTGGLAIKDLIADSRLVVHSYDSTGILETLSQNIPTLAFWQNGFDHLRDSAKPQYQLLVDTGIVHLTPESVAKKVNEVWDDVDGWWGQSIIQDARKQFCSRYARQSENPIRELKKILMK
jgi:putative transferase (TIGR04331 family)